jgi:purine-nucleoside phosphorylase
VAFVIFLGAGRYAALVDDARERAARAAGVIAQRSGVTRHDATVVLGSGWDRAADSLGSVVAEIPTAQLPGFLPLTAPGHRGLLRSYDLEGLAVLVFFGRTHLYEGHGPAPVAHAVRTAAATGARLAVLTNASGGLRPDWAPGTAAVLADHINWTQVSPLVGPSFVDLTDAWSPRLRRLARELDPSLVEGVYAQLTGPAIQTAAETEMLRTLGADLVGMSTVVEAIAAREAGLELFGLSAVTTREGTGEVLDPDEVVAIAERTAARSAQLVARLLLSSHTAGATPC